MNEFKLSMGGETGSDVGLFDCGDFATLAEALAAADAPDAMQFPIMWFGDDVIFNPTGKIIASRKPETGGQWVFTPDFEALRILLIRAVPGVDWGHSLYNHDRNIEALRAALPTQYPDVDWPAVFKAAAAFELAPATCRHDDCQEPVAGLLIEHYGEGGLRAAKFVCAKHGAELAAPWDTDDADSEGDSDIGEDEDSWDYGDTAFGAAEFHQGEHTSIEALVRYAKFIEERWWL